MTDQELTLQSILSFPDQISDAWKQADKLVLPIEYSRAQSICFCGMGGSAYGGRIIKALYQDKLKIPIDLITDYHLPAWVNPQTLLIAASYSGNTEETFSCAQEAISRNAMIVGISKGGHLIKLLDENKKSYFCFSDKHNPSLQPRMGQGYMLTGHLAILTKLNYIDITSKDIETASIFLHNQSNEPILNYTESMRKRIVIFVGAQFLAGAIHAIQNPCHETGKHLAFYTILPETNHHLLEGLMYPENLKDQIMFVFVKSNLYEKNILLRYELTKEIINKYHIPLLEIDLKGNDKLTQIFGLINIGNYLSYNLALQHNVNPIKVPYVDYFKKQLNLFRGD